MNSITWRVENNDPISADYIPFSFSINLADKNGKYLLNITSNKATAPK